MSDESAEISVPNKENPYPPEYLDHPDAAFGLMSMVLEESLTGRHRKWDQDPDSQSFLLALNNQTSEISQQRIGRSEVLNRNLGMYYLLGARVRYDVTPTPDSDDNIVTNLSERQIQLIQTHPTFWGSKPFVFNMGIDPVKQMQVLGNINSPRPRQYLKKFEDYLLATDPVIAQAVSVFEANLTQRARTDRGTIDTWVVTQNRQVAEAHTILMSRIIAQSDGGTTGSEMRKKALRMLQMNGICDKDYVINRSKVTDPRKFQALTTVVKLLSDDITDVPEEFRNYVDGLLPQDYVPSLVRLDREDGQLSGLEKEFTRLLPIDEDFRNYKPPKGGSIDADIGDDDERTYGNITPSSKPRRGAHTPKTPRDPSVEPPSAFNKFVDELDMSDLDDRSTTNE